MPNYAKAVNGIVVKVLVGEADYLQGLIDDSPGDWFELPDGFGIGALYNRASGQCSSGQPTFAVHKVDEIASFTATREKMCARVDGIGNRLERAGDAVSAASCDAVVDALLNIHKHASVTTATDLPSLKAALLARYGAAVALASPAAKAEFKRYDNKA